MSSKYERELRDIFEGNYEEYTKSLSDAKLGFYRILKDKPFGVIRGAGSFGIDLVAMRGSLYLPIEVKSSKHETIHFSNDKRLSEQVDMLIDTSEQCDIPVIYAQRLKSIRGERWSIFRLDTPATEELFSELPVVPKTLKGNRKLVWDEGMSLTSFLCYLFTKGYIGDDS